MNEKNYTRVSIVLFFFSFILTFSLTSTGETRHTPDGTDGFNVHRLVWTVVEYNPETLRAGTGPGEMVLSFKRTSFSFHYTLPEPSAVEKNKYAYKMEGFDEHWRMAGNEHTATYAGLKPGEYVFKIKSLNSDKTSNEQAIALTVIALPSWWRTPAAFLLYFLILVLAGVFYGLWRRNIKMKNEKEYLIIKETERRAEEAELKANVARARTLAVSEESNRKSIELEDARKFQLSMLPGKVPDLPHLDIAVSMKTATEVGGDYYDFKVAEDGALFVVCGDATGHGLKAGTMISVIKTLFVADVFGPDEDFNRFFRECTGTIKKVGLKNLHMALAMLRIENYSFTVSAAGMPPVFIYRKENDIVETVTLKAPPLGALKSFDYRYDYINAEPGDTVLLLTDGLPELFNREKKMFGYDCVGECLKEVGTKGSEEIVSHLNKKADEWLNYKPRDDDMTFVVITFK